MTKKLQLAFRTKLVSSEMDNNQWMSYLKSIGCSLGWDIKAEDNSVAVLSAEESESSITNLANTISTWNPQGDGSVIFVPIELAEKILVLGDLP